MSILEFRQVTRRFGGLRAIDDVSFNVAENEILGLIGPNGAGKTTLFSMASGFLRPSAGEIWFDGNRIDGLAAPKVCATGLARTFQIVRPFGDMSVLDNIMIGSFLKHHGKAEARAHAEAVIDRFGMSDRRDQMARTLTIGGRKRLEIAKAMATEPKMLMLDEVMAGLTAVETANIMDLIRSLRDDGVSILLVEHNMHAVLNLCDRAVVIHHGQKICEGHPEEVAQDPTVVEAYLGKEDD